MIAGGGGVSVCVELFFPLTVLACMSASSMHVFVSSKDMFVLISSMSVNSRASHIARGWSFIGRDRAMWKTVIIRRSGVVIESENSRSLLISATCMSCIFWFAAISSSTTDVGTMAIVGGGVVVVVVTPLTLVLLVSLS